MSVLAIYQRTLCASLLRQHSPQQIREALLAEDALAPLRDYVLSMDDTALAVAAALAAQWGMPPQSLQ